MKKEIKGIYDIAVVRFMHEEDGVLAPCDFGMEYNFALFDNDIEDGDTVLFSPEARGIMELPKLWI